jgi:hypothetical protein
MQEAGHERRYEAGDTVKLTTLLDHKATLKDVRLVFAHEHERQSVPPLIARGEPTPVSERDAEGSIRSRVDAEITLPRTVVPGIYHLDRISYETGEGRLGHLQIKGGALPEAARITFEVFSEPEDAPSIVDITFADS